MNRIKLSLVNVLMICFVFVISSCEKDEEINNPPSVEIVTPETNATYAFSSSINLECIVTDKEDKTIPQENIQWESDIDGILGTGSLFTCNSLSINNHVITVIVKDSKNKTSNASVNITIVQSSLPNIFITHPSHNITCTEGKSISFKCVANEMLDGELTGNSIIWKSNIDGELGSGNNITISNLSVNNHQIIATATDSQHESNSDTIWVEVLADTPPTIEITKPVDASEYSDVNSVELACNASDSYDGELSGNSIIWSSSIDGEIGAGCNLSVSGLSLGNHTITVTATDSDSNTSSDAVNITIYEVNKMDVMLDWMLGSFSSQNQSETSTDPYHFDVRRKVVQIWENETDGFWVYLEQAYATSENDPYFQRVYHFYEDGNTIKNVIYKIDNQEAYVGSWETPEDFNNLTTTNLIERENCGVTFEFTDGHFYGTTIGKNCISSINGVSYMTSEQWIYESRWDSWDLGWNESDNVVMGPYSPYQFDKL